MTDETNFLEYNSIVDRIEKNIHDSNNQLFNLIYAADHINSNLNTPSNNKYINVINESIEELKNNVADLQSLSDALSIHHSKLNIHSILLDAIQLLEQGNNHTSAIQVNCLTDNPFINGDLSALRNAFLALLTTLGKEFVVSEIVISNENAGAIQGDTEKDPDLTIALTGQSNSNQLPPSFTISLAIDPTLHEAGMIIKKHQGTIRNISESCSNLDLIIQFPIAR